MTKIYLFPGQGSQSIGMGKNLFQAYPELVKTADDILGYSIEKLCLEDPQNNLGNTAFTQPALFIVNALICMKKIQDSGEKPGYAAGHSLGEYNALHAAGAFDFSTGLSLVKKRGEIMSRAENGGMAAVIGIEPEKIKKALLDASLDSIDIANFNSPSQTVISGPKVDIPAAQKILEQAGARMIIPLKVSGAFHSRYMKEAMNEFSAHIDACTFHQLSFTVISNATGAPYENARIGDSLKKQMTSPVRWTETIQYLKQLPSPVFEEIGPGTVLTKLLKQIS